MNNDWRAHQFVSKSLLINSRIEIVLQQQLMIVHTDIRVNYGLVVAQRTLIWSDYLIADPKKREEVKTAR